MHETYVKMSERILQITPKLGAFLFSFFLFLRDKHPIECCKWWERARGNGKTLLPNFFHPISMENTLSFEKKLINKLQNMVCNYKELSRKKKRNGKCGFAMQIQRLKLLTFVHNEKSSSKVSHDLFLPQPNASKG